MKAIPKDWERKVEAMRQCQWVADLVRLHGLPNHKVQEDGFEIWHYPLGIDAQMLYSIHVSVGSDQSCQAFLFFAPTGPDHAHAPRRWWEFWKRSGGVARRTPKTPGKPLESILIVEDRSLYEAI